MDAALAAEMEVPVIYQRRKCQESINTMLFRGNGIKRHVNSGSPSRLSNIHTISVFIRVILRLSGSPLPYDPNSTV